MIEIKTPTDQLTADKVFTNDNAATSVLLSIYNQLSIYSSLESYIAPVIGSYADEFATTSSSRFVYLNNAVPTDDAIVQSLWTGLYNAIYQSNSLIENLPGTTVSDSAKGQITGEAKFLRAFSYFYLVNLFGDVPLVTISNAQTSSLAKRETMANVYQQIIKDLLDAQAALPEAFVYPDKIRASKMAATALLARVYLYQQKWAESISESTSLIQLSGKIMLDSLNRVFIKNSNETILQFWKQNGFAAAGMQYIPSAGNTPSYPITNFLLNSFATGDLRSTSWVNKVTVQGIAYYIPYKYKKRSISPGADGEYAMVLRLGEQYLIRAEASIQTNNLAAAISDINVLRSRAGLSLLNNTYSQAQLLIILQQERWNELFAEWGHRFFDLKRWGLLDVVLAARKTQWKSTAALLPVPQQEINTNPALTQNPGY